MKYLKEKIYYTDLYDLHTVEQCRRTEKNFEKEGLNPSKDKESVEEAGIKTAIQKLMLHFEAGERYLNKEKTIREWMDDDQKKDALLESVEAPTGIRCLICRNIVKPTFKELWTELDKPDRILFMYDCPNKCVPRRAFFSGGEEYRVKPNLCPRCDIKLNQEEINTDEKLVTKYICSKCGYTNTEELIWTHKKEEPVDENFAADRDRFCLTEEEGKKYQSEKWNMEQLAKFAEEWKKEDEIRAERLKANPKGFHLDGAGYTCAICRDGTPEGDNWYDEYGIKCLVCQKAIDEGEIPASLAKDEESWYSKYDLESRFNLKGPRIKKWVKDGVLKARTVTRYGEGVHVQVFLVEDNKDFLPPKNLTESQGVTEIKNGEKWHHSEPWYRFVNPWKHLKGYKIMDHLEWVKEDGTVIENI